MRLGTYYRSLILDKLGIAADKDLVLDVGCFDGYWLSQQTEAKMKIAVDMNPLNKFDNVSYIKANALNLPFKDNVFDSVFSFDVIEHVENDLQFFDDLCRVCKINGEIVISTPHKEIKIFPPFLTNWVSKKWGHYRTNGYLKDELIKMNEKKFTIKILHLKEIFYRNFYFLLRFMWGININITKSFVKLIAYLDAISLFGANGHLIVKVTKNK